MASCSDDHFIKIWYISTGETQRTIPTYNQKFCRSLKLVKNGTILAAGNRDGVTQFVGLVDTSIDFIKILPNCCSSVNGRILDLQLVNEHTLAMSSQENTIVLFDLNTFVFGFILQNHTDDVNGLKMITSEIIASGSDDTTVKLWNTTDGSLIRTLANHTDSIYNGIDLINAHILVYICFFCTHVKHA